MPVYVIVFHFRPFELRMDFTHVIRSMMDWAMPAADLDNFTLLLEKSSRLRQQGG